MTIEQLCECSADELAKLTDEELTNYLSPYFKATRPDMIDKTKIHKIDRRKEVVERTQIKQAEDKISNILKKAQQLFGDDI